MFEAAAGSYGDYYEGIILAFLEGSIPDIALAAVPEYGNRA
jgi:hypothetical protein